MVDPRSRQEPAVPAAVERYSERLSEASRHVPEAYERNHPNIDWRGVGDIGNVLRHAYEQAVDEEIWAIVKDDPAPLKAAVEAMIAEHRSKRGASDRRSENGS